MFLDEATIRVRGGHGGNGVITFASSYLKKRGGPDGGNGGSGGDILLVADSSLSTLYAFRNQPLFAAGNGVGGGRNNAQGVATARSRRRFGKHRESVSEGWEGSGSLFVSSLSCLRMWA